MFFKARSSSLTPVHTHARMQRQDGACSLKAEAQREMDLKVVVEG